MVWIVGCQFRSSAGCAGHTLAIMTTFADRLKKIISCLWYALGSRREERLDGGESFGIR